MADIDLHNYDIFETRYQQYVAKPSHMGEKWSVKFGARSAPVSSKHTNDMDTDEGQLITQQVLQTALEHERKRQRSQRLQRPRSETDLLHEEIIPDKTVFPGPFEYILSKTEVSLKAKKPWYDKEMVELKCKVHKMEKKWMKYKLDSCWQAYKARNSYYYLLNSKKRQSLRSKIRVQH